MSKEIVIHDHTFKVNPTKLPFMTGFRGSLAEIFSTVNDEYTITKQILLVGSHYTTWSKLHNNHTNKSFWVFWNDPVIFYDESNIEEPDYVYYENGIEVGRSAFLCSSKYYTGSVGGIFANDDNRKCIFVRNNSDLKKYIDWLNSNDEYFYIARFDCNKDNQFSYVLKK